MVAVALLLTLLLANTHLIPKVLLFLSSHIANLQRNEKDYNAFSHVYLKGIFKPIREEFFGVPAEIVSGSVLPELNGVYLYNGPNPTDHQLQRRYHYFDGHGFIRMIRLTNGAAHFSSQYIQTPNYQLSKMYDQSVFCGVGEIMGFVGVFRIAVLQPLLETTFGLSKFETVPANTAFAVENHRIFATHEGGFPFELQILPNYTIVSQGFERFNGTLDFEFAAHTRRDPVDGSLYFVGHSANPSSPAYKTGALRNGTVTNYISIYRDVRTFAHDMLITENFIVLLETSVVFEFSNIISGEFLEFQDSQPLRIGLLPKNSSDSSTINWFSFDRPLSILHCMNAWEGDDRVVVHCPASTSFNGFNSRNLTLTNHYHMVELNINLTSGGTQVIFYDDDRIVEFPNVHPDYIGRPSNFGFTGQQKVNNNHSNPAGSCVGFSNLVKVNMYTRQFEQSIKLPNEVTVFEPFVVPKKKSTRNVAKSDYSHHVYLAALGYNHATHTGEFFVFDGESMSDDPVLRLRLGNKRVTPGFHGLWLSDETLQAHFEAWNRALL